jgi:hypothetical protein
MTTGKLGVWGPVGWVEAYEPVSRTWPVVPEHLDVKDRSLATEYSAMPDSYLTTHPRCGK